MAKIVKILDVGDSFELTRVLKEVTKSTGSTAVNTVHTLKEPGSIILLNGCVITPEQWEEIASQCPETKWEYV